MPSSETLSVVQDLLRNERVGAAMQLLERHLRESPRDIDGWWLGAQHASKHATRVHCLKRILKLDPNHAGALEALNRLQQDNSIEKIEEIEALVGGQILKAEENPGGDVELVEEPGASSLESSVSATLRSEEFKLTRGEFSGSEKGKKENSKKRRGGVVREADGRGKFARIWEVTRRRVWSISTMTVLVISGLCVMSYQLHLQVSELSNQTTEAVRQLSNDVGEVKTRLGEYAHFSKNISNRQTQINSENEVLRRELNELTSALRRVEQKQTRADQILSSVDRNRLPDRSRNIATAAELSPNPEPSKPAGPQTIDGGAEVSIPFPKSIKDIVVASGGRYLVCRMDSFSGLMLVDMVKRKLDGTISLPSEDFLYSAGGDRILVYFRENNLFQLWSLSERKLVKSKPNGIGTIATTLIMGHSNDKTALVRSATGTDQLSPAGGYLLKLSSLEPMGGQPQGNGRRDQGRFTATGHNGSFRDFVHHRSNGDLSLVSEWCTSHTPTGIGVLRINGGAAESRYEHNSSGNIMVGDDNRLYTSGGGIYNSQLTRIGQVSGGYPVPGIGGRFYLVIQGNEKGNSGVQVFQSGGTSPIVNLTALTSYQAGNDGWASTSFTSDRRVVFAPTLGYLAYMNMSGDRLMVRDFDLKKVLANSGVDYLIVLSTPTETFVPGKEWSYQLDVTQKEKRPLKFSLQASPEGMSVSETGLLTWQVPTDRTAAENIILLIENDNGDSTFHNFEIRPGSEAGSS